jgi:hypothetical protein
MQVQAMSLKTVRTIYNEFRNLRVMEVRISSGDPVGAILWPMYVGIFELTLLHCFRNLLKAQVNLSSLPKLKCM